MTRLKTKKKKKKKKRLSSKKFHAIFESQELKAESYNSRWWNMTCLSNRERNLHIARPFTNRVKHKLCLETHESSAEHHYPETESFRENTQEDKGQSNKERRIGRYQFMDSENLRSTKFINFSHAATIVFQCSNNCRSHINNIYRLNPVKDILVRIVIDKFPVENKRCQPAISL